MAHGRTVTTAQANTLTLSANQSGVSSGHVRLVNGDIVSGAGRHEFLGASVPAVLPNTIPGGGPAAVAALFGISLGDAVDFIAGGLGLGGGSGPTVDPGVSFAPCVFPFVRQADGSCKFDLDPGIGTGAPGGNGGGAPSGGTSASGLARPTSRAVNTLICPTFADGKKGLLWMNALTGEVVCLPRGTNGRGFGLIRKNKPRAKPFISAAMKKQLGVSSQATKKAKEFAKLTGQVCESRSVRAARNARGK